MIKLFLQAQEMGPLVKLSTLKTCLFSHGKPQSLWPILPEQDSLGVVLSNTSSTTTVLEIRDGCQGFMLVVHNVRQPVLCCGDGMCEEHTGPLFSCQMQRCNSCSAFGAACGCSCWVPEGNYPPAGKQINSYYLQTLIHTHKNKLHS